MKKHIIYAVVVSFFFNGFIFAQDSLGTSVRDSLKIKELEKRLEALENKQEEDELKKLLQEAETTSATKEKKNTNKVFQSGQRSLQAINPEISVVGDAYGQYNIDDPNAENKTGAYFRVLGIHIQSNLDPYSLAKAAIEFTPDGVELGEAYLTWTNFIPSISLTAGKFRQQFGVINRWHKHSLDQFDYPLPIKTIFGEDGLNQIGLSFNWLLPSLGADASDLVIEVTNAQNNNLFMGETFTFPATLLHFKNYWDLSRNTYLELGLTGMYGKNRSPIYDDSRDIIGEGKYNTLVYGADLTLFWQPVNKALYHSFLWRTELFYADKEISPNQKIKTFGGYSYIEYKFSEQWQAGIRFDYTQPFEVDNSSKYSFQIVPYITWWQSHWVKLRLQYNYLEDTELAFAPSTLRLQVIWAVGPHKHDRY